MSFIYSCFLCSLRLENHHCGESMLIDVVGQSYLQTYVSINMYEFSDSCNEANHLSTK